MKFQILTTFGVPWQIFVSVPSIKFHGTLSSGNYADTWTDMTKRCFLRLCKCASEQQSYTLKLITIKLIDWRDVERITNPCSMTILWSVVHLLSKVDLKQFFTSKETQYLAYCSLVVVIWLHAMESAHYSYTFLNENWWQASNFESCNHSWEGNYCIYVGIPKHVERGEKKN